MCMKYQFLSQKNQAPKFAIQVNGTSRLPLEKEQTGNGKLIVCMNYSDSLRFKPTAFINKLKIHALR